VFETGNAVPIRHQPRGNGAALAARSAIEKPGQTFGDCVSALDDLHWSVALEPWFGPLSALATGVDRPGELVIG